MTPHNVASPVSLSYVAALRGITPRKPGAAFAYAVAGCKKPALLTCLAASNPEGRFYGIVDDAATCAAAEKQAHAQRVENVFFIHASLASLRDGKPGLLPPLHYLCADESVEPMTPSERAAFFDIAKNTLLPGGILHYTYRAYSDEAGPLRFLVREFAPEMNADQASGFLQEIRTLGRTYLAKHPEVAAKLESAIDSKIPDEFFSGYDAGEARSGAFDTIVALRPRGFSYAGDSHIAHNYINFTVAPDAQDIIMSCRENPLYEPLKDFTLDRTLRSDIWCREPALRTANAAELFGGFTYGIVMAPDSIPAEIKTEEGVIDLSTPLFKQLTALMSMMPASIGDFLAHPDGKEFAPANVLEAVQVLIACGIAQPMRGLYQSSNITSIAQPRFAGAFNRTLGQTELSSNEVFLASPALGNAVSVSAREILVMQALDRAGLENSIAALLPELQRFAKNPALAAMVSTSLETPTETSAHAMIEDAVSRSIVQWYAYGLLEAA